MDNISKDSISALAIIDQVEKGLMEKLEGAEEKLEQLITGILKSENGHLFMAQGIKAMLVWMQREDPTEEVTMENIWRTLNLHLSDAERDEFNLFKTTLWLEAEWLFDRLKNQINDPVVINAFLELKNNVANIPTLER
jgi:hypothetical protein